MNQEEEAQKELQKRLQQELERRQLELQKQALLRSLLEPKAKERLTRIKIANPELGQKVESLILSLYQMGSIKRKINEEEFITLLRKVSERKRRTRIIRK
ncbi:hypothetical protein DRN74_04380 [Candidatus Micrarchaeota archaeon]|nr:MAG: hypothetical protein DRN74_04380 [Candidatus Micrarchaeota archaeon]